MKNEKNSKFDFTSLQSKIESTLIPIAQKISNQKYLAAIKDSMTILIPLTIIGGFACLLAQPPVNPETMDASNFFNQLLLGWYNWAQANFDLLMTPYNLTLGAISLYVVVAIAYRLSQRYKLPKIETSFTALLVYLCIGSAPQTLENGSFMPTANLGATGMFTAIIIGIICVEVTRFCFEHNITIKMPDSVPPMVASPFKILIPMAFNVVGFMILNVLSISFIGSDLCNLLVVILQPLLSATESLPSMLLIYLIAGTLWFFGIHGDNMTGAILTPITTLNVALNLEAFNAGKDMTHIFAGQFLGIWGGWQTSIALLITMWIIAKSKHLRSLSKLAPVSTAFNINEPLVFGIPEVLNLYTFIPFTICKIINISIAYAFTSFGFIGEIYMVLPWTTPAPLAVFLSTMDIKALLLWIAVLILDVLIMIPFIKSYDKTLVLEENSSISK